MHWQATPPGTTAQQFLCQASRPDRPVADRADEHESSRAGEKEKPSVTMLGSPAVTYSPNQLLRPTWSTGHCPAFENLVVDRKAVEFTDQIVRWTEALRRGFGPSVDQLNRAAS